jgi:hypothetical protein
MLACRAGAFISGSQPHNRRWSQDKLEEFMGYVSANLTSIPNYADRHRHGEPIATGFVESAVNQVVRKRFVKKQQMRWTPSGAPHLLQVRTRVLNKQLRGDLSAGTAACSPCPLPSRLVWRLSTRNGPLSKSGRSPFSRAAVLTAHG